MSKSDEEREIKRLIGLLNDRTWRKREEAVEALVQIGEPAVSYLLSVLENRDGNCADAARVLGRTGDPRAIEPLIDALYTKNVHLSQEAAEALGRIGDSRAVQPLIDVLRHEWDDTETITVWQKAAAALAALGEPAVPPLLKAAKDEDENVRRGAIEALGQLHDARGVDSLIAALQDKDSLIRASSADALARIGDPRAIEPLIALLDDDDSHVRSHAFFALAELGGSSVLTSLASGLNDPDPQVRRTVLHSLGKLQDPRIHDLLLEALKDVDAQVRSAAILTLSRVGDERALPALTWIKQNDTSYAGANKVKDHAAYAIQNIQRRLQNDGLKKEKKLDLGK